MSKTEARTKILVAIDAIEEKIKKMPIEERLYFRSLLIEILRGANEL